MLPPAEPVELPAVAPAATVESAPIAVVAAPTQIDDVKPDTLAASVEPAVTDTAVVQSSDSAVVEPASATAAQAEPDKPRAMAAGRGHRESVLSVTSDPLRSLDFGQFEYVDQYDERLRTHCVLICCDGTAPMEMESLMETSVRRSCRLPRKRPWLVRRRSNNV